MDNSRAWLAQPSLAVLCASVLLGGGYGSHAETWSVTSPNGLVQLSVELADLGSRADFPKGPRLYYRVEHGRAGQREVVLEASPLGLQLQGGDLANGLDFDPTTAKPAAVIEERYEQPHGKRRICHNRAEQLTLPFRNAAGQRLDLDVRAYDDGVAFRYRLPGNGGAPLTLKAEETGFAIPAGSELWKAPSDKATIYAPAYETYYEQEAAPGSTAPNGVGWSFPMLLRTPGNRWALITEADVRGNFCGSRLSSTAPSGVFRVALPDPAEGNGTGSIEPSSPLPWEMPWRVIVVGDSPGAMIDSTLVTDVCPPSRVADTSWIKPGRVAWSWWSDNPSPQDGEKQKKFVDLAAEMGWEYVLVDANWDLMDNGNIHDVLRHAKAKGVGVLLWYNSGGPHNVVTEKPRDTLTYAPVRRFELDLLKKWGVSGIKVDFWQSDKQNIIALYHELMADAAEKQIMVNFHGCTLPRGWERTWPHLMAMEAIRGEECYLFDPKFPERAAAQNTITPFTRNAVGPMDYTPVAFSDVRYPHRTTFAHELALSVVFESGWLHFADKPEAYRALPEAPKDFLRTVPVAWDDTRFVAGEPGKFIVLARRKGDTWFLAGVSGQDQPRDERFRLGTWLPAGRYTVTQIGDGPDRRQFATDNATVESGQEMGVKFLPQGGFVATLRPLR